MFTHGRKTQRLSSDILQRVINRVRQTSHSFSSTLASEHQRLAGQVAIITGGVSGIGAATARLFTRHGARVVIADIQPLLGEKLQKELGPQAKYVECDVRKEEDIQRLVHTAYALESRLDIYHSNAGIIGSVGPIDETRIDEYDATTAVNLRAAVIGVKHAVRFMRPRRKGSIVISGSVASVMGGMGPHAYTIAKAGLLGLVKSCAAELGPLNIRVNMISAARVATPLTAFALSALAGRVSGSVTVDDIDGIVAKPTLLPDTLLTELDVANAALFLASDMGGYIAVITSFLTEEELLPTCSKLAVILGIRSTYLSLARMVNEDCNNLWGYLDLWQILRFRTARGRDAISYNGYSYRFDRRSAHGDMFWRCLTEGCRARLQTDENLTQPAVRGVDHSHPSSLEDGLIRVAQTRMRDRAVTENTPIPQIYQEEANRLASSEAASAMLPVLRSIDTTLYRARRQRLLPLPRSRADIVIPESLRTTEAGESFVFLLNNNIIVFGAPGDFDALCVATHVYMDGTFDTSPQLFRQLFTLHVFFGDRQVPLLYVLMSSKERAAYISLFRGLKDLAVTSGHRFSPQFILSDFESGLIPAVRDEFPQVHHQGCYFHFTQALWRKVGELGLVQHYTHNNPVKDAVRQVMALGFLPIDDVHLGLQLIRLSLIGLDRTILEDFLECFQRQWFERISFSMWNVHGLQRRTNNNCEGWHHKFNRFVRHHHPNIWELIERIRSEHCTSVRERLQIAAGQQVQRTLVRYTRANQRLDNLRNQYATGNVDILEYLKEVGRIIASRMS